MVHPAAALAAAQAGTLALMPPTLSILLELAELGSLAAVLAAAEGRIVTPILPTLARGTAGWRFRYPAAEASRERHVRRAGSCAACWRPIRGR